MTFWGIKFQCVFSWCHRTAQHKNNKIICKCKNLSEWNVNGGGGNLFFHSYRMALCALDEACIHNRFNQYAIRPERNGMLKVKVAYVARKGGRCARQLHRQTHTHIDVMWFELSDNRRHGSDRSILWMPLIMMIYYIRIECDVWCDVSMELRSIAIFIKFTAAYSCKMNTLPLWIMYWNCTSIKLKTHLTLSALF